MSAQKCLWNSRRQIHNDGVAKECFENFNPEWFRVWLKEWFRIWYVTVIFTSPKMSEAIVSTTTTGAGWFHFRNHIFNVVLLVFAYSKSCLLWPFSDVTLLSNPQTKWEKHCPIQKWSHIISDVAYKCRHIRHVGPTVNFLMYCH